MLDLMSTFACVSPVNLRSGRRRANDGSSQEFFSRPFGPVLGGFGVVLVESDRFELFSGFQQAKQAHYGKSNRFDFYSTAFRRSFFFRCIKAAMFGCFVRQVSS